LATLVGKKSLILKCILYTIKPNKLPHSEFMKKRSILLLVVISAALVLLYKNSNNEKTTQLSQQSLTQADVKKILETDVDQLWQEDFNHYKTGLIGEVAKAISELSRSNYLENRDLNGESKTKQSLEKLTYYLRIYSSFGPKDEWQKNSAKQLNQALLDLQNMAGFYKITPATARLHENYAVALYRLYFLKPMSIYTKDQLKPLSKLVTLYANSLLPTSNKENKAIDYALWEILRASALLPYKAYNKNNKEMIAALISEQKLQQALIAFITAANASRDNNEPLYKNTYNNKWPQQHATWALAQFYNVYNKHYWNEYEQRSKVEQQQLDDDKQSLPIEQKMDDLDNAVWNALSTDKGLTGENLKQAFSIPYVVTTFRGKSACEENTLKDRCILPALEQALPLKHVCSDSIYILAQTMTNQQLLQTCEKLTSQESNFHQLLNTKREAVANDNNDKLRVVIFDDASQYNIYGQLLFDINTNNGGMYIEGTPQDPENIGTFYSYQHFWARPKFAVWNLNHEYVHYLDGRFVKYDTFGHFPDSLVWWSEGLAEYISKGDNNPKALKLMAKTKREEWPSLADIFTTEYKDGTDKVYKWGYLAVRFMSDKHHDIYLKLAHSLKTDFFTGYKKDLTKAGESFEQEFALWLQQLNANFTDTSKIKDPHKPRTFSHYAYKTYLKPPHLTEDKNHMIWQYWHANALKK